MFPKSIAFLFSFVCCAVLSLTAFLHRSVVHNERGLLEDSDAARYLRTIAEREEDILSKVELLSNKLAALEKASTEPAANVLSKVEDKLSGLATKGKDDSESSQRLLAKVQDVSNRLEELYKAAPLSSAPPPPAELATEDLTGTLDPCQQVRTSKSSIQMFTPYGSGCPHHMMSYQPRPLSISTVIPALARKESMGDFPALFKSIEQQTVQPDEVVIAISGVFDHFGIRYAYKLPSMEELSKHEISKSTRFCQETFEEFTKLYTKAPIKLICIGERLTAGRARMVGIRASSSDILGFVDSDDTELPIRNQVIQNVFGPKCSKEGERMILLHSARQKKIHEYEKERGYSKPEMNKLLPDDSNAACVADEENVGVYNGHQLYRQVLANKNGWRVANGVAYGHPVVRRKAFDTAMYASISNGEDALFIRDYLLQLGPNEGRAMYLYRPLTTYFQPGKANGDVLPKERTKK